MSHKSQKKPPKNSPLLPQPGALQRLAQVERAVNDLSHVQVANKPVLDAVVEILGTQVVLDKVNEQRVRSMRAQNAARTESVKKMIEAGTLIPAETVTAESIILTEETTEDGTVLEPGQTYDTVASLPEEIAVQLIGGKAGASVDTGNGRKMRVVEVLALAPEKPPVPPAEEAVLDSGPAV